MATRTGDAIITEDGEQLVMLRLLAAIMEDRLGVRKLTIAAAEYESIVGRRAITVRSSLDSLILEVLTPEEMARRIEGPFVGEPTVTLGRPPGPIVIGASRNDSPAAESATAPPGPG